MADFTRRISQCNRSELVVVMYEMYFSYLEDARAASDKQDWEEYKAAIRKSQRVLDELVGALNFSYELAKELYRIYMFCKDTLAKALYKREEKELDDAERLMRTLYDSFTKVAEADSSAPLMQNTQQVYAGYTYGRDDLVESQDFDTSRGFLV
jgi:flagellar protein FliS